MGKKVLNEILSMDKKELRNLVEEQGNKIDLGIYLLSIWDIRDAISLSCHNIAEHFFNIERVFHEYGWEINDYLNKRKEYKYFEEKDIDERKEIIIADYLFRLNPKLKAIDYFEFFDEDECALKISVTLEGNQIIHIDMIDISEHIDEVIKNINRIENETFKIYQSLY